MNTNGMKVGKAAVVAASACAWAGAAFGQASPVLSAVPGLNEVQRPTAVAIDTLCPQLAPLNRTEGQDRLFTTCSAMRGLARTTPSLVPGTMQAAAAEEMHAQGRVATTTVARNAIYGRLLALRAGGRGLLFSGPAPDPQGRALAAAEGVRRGGGAAADGIAAGPWGGFLNVNYNTGDRDDTSREDGFDFDDYGLTGGVDYRFSDQLAAGVALSWSRTDVDFSRDAGDVESDNWGLTAYAAYNIGDWYVDAQLGYAWLDYETRRNIVLPALGINTAARGDTNGQQWSATVGAGYDLRMNRLTVTPYGRVDYLNLEVDDFTEREPNAGLGLDIGSRTTRSLQSALGARLSTEVSTGYGVFVPYAALEWNHEFKNDSRSLVAKYTHDPFNTFFVIPTENPDRNFFTLAVGVSTQMPGGLSAFAALDSVLGMEDTTAYALTVGVRGEF